MQKPGVYTCLYRLPVYILTLGLIRHICYYNNSERTYTRASASVPGKLKKKVYKYTNTRVRIRYSLKALFGRGFPELYTRKGATEKKKMFRISKSDLELTSICGKWISIKVRERVILKSGSNAFLINLSRF